MKKIIRYSFISILFILLLIVTSQICYFRKNNGNCVVLLSNYTYNKNIGAKVYIDNKKRLETKNLNIIYRETGFTNSLFHSHKIEVLFFNTQSGSIICRFQDSFFQILNQWHYIELQEKPNNISLKSPNNTNKIDNKKKRFEVLYFRKNIPFRYYD